MRELGATGVAQEAPQFAAGDRARLRRRAYVHGRAGSLTLLDEDDASLDRVDLMAGLPLERAEQEDEGEAESDAQERQGMVTERTPGPAGAATDGFTGPHGRFPFPFVSRRRSPTQSWMRDLTARSAA